MHGLSDYDDFDATGLADGVAKGRFSPDELLSAALERVDALNPALNAVTQVQADRARANIAAGLPDGPLSGVPFLLKDLGAEAVGFPGNNGSRLLRNTAYSFNSNLVERLIAAGLVIFGRTTSPEGGIGCATEAAVYGGPTRNPWNPAHTPGGSSGGSGAAVAAGIVPAAHGSDGGGSVRIPASSCGLFGFKPTRARLPDGPASGEGWGGMAIEGFLTRSVRDSALLLDIGSGSDLGAPYVAPPLEAGFRAAMDNPAKGLRVALCTTTFDGDAVHPECAAAAETAAKLLEDMGHHVEIARPEADNQGMMRAWTKIVACGTALGVRSKLARLGRDLGPDDLEPVSRSAVEYAAEISGADYLEALEEVHDYGRQMARFLDRYDLLVSPTLAEPPAKVGRFSHNRQSYLDYRLGPDGVFAYSPYTACFNASGQPAASLPLAWSSEGLPIGVHLAAAFGADELLMSVCAELERAAPWFKKRPAMAKEVRK
ncbi:amidase [Nisaea acidiphila]|uniref:Amidase n=1 Tax=Nisaea acidiphila TaxID=1862145 RepID=A0A9J7AX56_9PROT|nr:amidase [Nisaea acidiphila]UUX51864.1 amidase [Nisaea acidiphila]